MRRSKRNLLIRVFVIILAGAAVICAGAWIVNGKISALKGNIATLSEQLREYDHSMVSVICAAEDIASGERITPEKLTFCRLPAEAVPVNVILSGEAAEKRFAGVDIFAGSYLTEAMLIDSVPLPSERELEYSCVETTENIGPGSCVDIRLVYPDGSDYIVLSHKTVYDLSEDYTRMLLQNDEEELIRMDSAIVDAYLIPGTRIYAAEYVERSLQPPAQVNYTPSVQAIELIANNPNIVKTASEYMKKDERLRIEGRFEYEND